MKRETDSRLTSDAVERVLGPVAPSEELARRREQAIDFLVNVEGVVEEVLDDNAEVMAELAEQERREREKQTIDDAKTRFLEKPGNVAVIVELAKR